MSQVLVIFIVYPGLAECSVEFIDRIDEGDGNVFLIVGFTQYPEKNEEQEPSWKSSLRNIRGRKVRSSVLQYL